jgi:hypothetical protein
MEPNTDREFKIVASAEFINTYHTYKCPMSAALDFEAKSTKYSSS